MKLQFKQQQYQIDATQAVVSCFEGQTWSKRREIFDRYFQEGENAVFHGMAEFDIFANPEIKIGNGDILNNLQKIQKANHLPLSTEMGRKKDFTIEMETGTGKTYVYTRTIFELSKNYNWNKFIIVVPSVAIREGVHKSLQITASHFAEIYGKNIHYHIYDNKNKSNLTNIKYFAQSDELQVIIMNYQAFNTKSGDARKIYEELDSMNSYKPVDLIRGTRPIIIIDEPQRISEKTEEILQEQFSPLFTLRYSATHKKKFHPVYRLDAVDAINQKLVKKIRAFGYESIGGSGENGYIFVDRIEAKSGQNPVAYVEYEILQASGPVKKLQKLEVGDDLYEKSGKLKQYDGWKVSNISLRDGGKIFLENREHPLEVGKVYGGIDEKHMARIRIRNTIKEHLLKEERLFQKGIKTLSLFFIDEVAKYRAYDENGEKIYAEYEKIFEEEYGNLVAQQNMFTPQYNAYLAQFSPQEVHNGYFSIDNHGKAINSKEKRGEGASDDVNAYDLIMRDKERLLSFEEPTRFIFSHSALREGWDNPNIFQICMLRASTSEISRRQEIGRGLRICVDKYGNRMDTSVLGNEFAEYNCLTVIAAESYESFAKNLQKEILADLSDRPIIITEEVLQKAIFTNNHGEIQKLSLREIVQLQDDLINRGYIDSNNSITEKVEKSIVSGVFDLSGSFSHIKDSVMEFLQKSASLKNIELIEDGARLTVREKELRPNENFYKKEFQDLWNMINYQSIYEVKFDSNELIEKSVEEINKGISVSRTLIKVTRGEQQEDIRAEDLKFGNIMKAASYNFEKADHVIGDVRYDMLGEISSRTQLTRKTIARILTQINPSEFQKYTYSPQAFIKQVSRIINEQKGTLVINNIVYHKVHQKFETDIFTISDLRGEIDKNIIETKKHIYDYLKFDSQIEKELAENMEKGEVKVYAKLPRGFYIVTPIGKYNPDWAIVIDKTDTKYIYFIAETKGTMSSMGLKNAEQIKIECARKHFQLLDHENVKYGVINTYSALMEEMI